MVGSATSPRFPGKKALIYFATARQHSPDLEPHEELPEIENDEAEDTGENPADA
jgi:hypothetical protein